METPTHSRKRPRPGSPLGDQEGGDEAVADEEVEHLVVVSIEGLEDVDVASSLRDVRISGLDTAQPILHFANRTFCGSARETVGTVVLFEREPDGDDCALVGTATHAMDFRRVRKSAPKPRKQ